MSSQRICILSLSVLCGAACSESPESIPDGGTSGPPRQDATVVDASQIDVPDAGARYVELVVVPDEVSFVGPGGGRAIRSFGVTEAGAYEAVEPEFVSADDQIADVRGARVRAREMGQTQITASFEGLTASVVVEVSGGPQPFASEIVATNYGPGAGFGQNMLPDIVFGPPQGAMGGLGSLDVLSLGFHGSITLGFGDQVIYDGPGPDFIVFENAFILMGTEFTFVEPGQVEVSNDGADWTLFPCFSANYPHTGCAGKMHVIAGPHFPDVDPTDPGAAGGDQFDLEGRAETARFVRITDAATSTAPGTNVGFDLDAVGIVHSFPRDVESIRATPSQLDLQIGEVVPLPRVDAIRAGGGALRGIETKITVSGTAVERDGALLRAVETGTTSLQLSAGPHSTRIEIEVLP